MPQDQQQWMVTIISVCAAALVLGLRIRRARDIKPLKVERLWILPAIYGAIAVLLFASHPPVGIVWIYALGAFAIGLLGGWFRGKLMAIHVDPETHELSQQGSRLAVAFIALLIVARFAARSYLMSGGGSDPAVIMSMTDVLLAFGLGFVAAQRLEMGMRAREMLAEIRGGT